MLVIGITGGVASGKSTVCKVLNDLGVLTIDADKLGHRAYEKGTPCYLKLIENFGDSIVAEDGEINRRKLGEIVFSASSKMTELTGIVWPEIRKMLIAELEMIKSGANSDSPAPVVAIEAAVMIEAGWQDVVDVLWVLRVDRNEAKDKLMARNNLTEVEAYKRIDSQISNEERCKHATFVLHNNLTMEQLEIETRRLLEQSVTSGASGGDKVG